MGKFARPLTVNVSIKSRQIITVLITDFCSYNSVDLLGVDGMRNEVESRATVLGEYIIENDATVRATAKVFKISKSTVHKDVTERLKSHNPELWRAVKVVLERNKEERHIRGGLATRRKYKGI